MKRKVWFGVLGVFITLSLLRCSDDELTGNAYVNVWILENMNIYYLWENEIPAKPDRSQQPDDFFYSLLSDKDRFSWIQEDYLELLNSLQGVNKEAGYEFILYRESEANENVIALVAYIKKGSPAATKDLLRGDVITHINGQQLNLSNYQSLLGQISENHTITYKRHNGSVFVDKGTLSLTTVEFAENPNYLDTIYEIGGKKIGYYVYNFFATGPTANSSQYNNEMDAVFANFKAEGITHLILDLRYNSGGAETATINLASLIGSGVTTNDVFAIREYNEIVTEAILNDPDLGEEFLIKKFLSKSQNVGTQLAEKVYVLTRSRTASASEMLINGLKPYMNVMVVGDTTVGKNVGSISIYENDDPKNTWGMQPIVVKTYNGLNQSDYDTGFIPDIADKDNSLVIQPLGDINENLLSLALNDIASSGRVNGMPGKLLGKMLATSLDRKRRNFNYTIDDSELVKRVKISLNN